SEFIGQKSFGAQSCNGICLGGAERRQQRGEKTDRGENEHDAAEDDWIVCLGVEEQCFHEPRNAGCGQQSKDETECGEPGALSENETKDIANLRAESKADAEFAGALRDAVSDEAVKTNAGEQQREQRKEAEER